MYYIEQCVLFFLCYMIAVLYNISLNQKNMNIRKKILFNPSHLKSHKPDSSDNTTANTKNSAILQQSKTMRFSNSKQITTRRQKNYLRTLSKQQYGEGHHLNSSSNGIRKRMVLPSSSSMMSHQNVIPKQKSIQTRKFGYDKQKYLDQLPSLISLKRTQILTSQKDRKFFDYPSSLHINSNKQIIPKLNKQHPKKPSLQQIHSQNNKPSNVQQINNFQVQQNEQLERRKQKFNSLNVMSFYTTQKSINVSKYSMISKQNSKQTSKQNSDQKKQSINHNKINDKVQQFKERQNSTKIHFNNNKKNQNENLSKENKIQNLDQQQKNIENCFQQQEQVQQEIVQQIQSKNDSNISHRMKQKSKKITKKYNNNKRQMNNFKKQEISNEWSQTLKSGFTSSSRQQAEQQNRQNDKSKDKDSSKFSKSNSSSMCQSEILDSKQLVLRKQTDTRKDGVKQENNTQSKPNKIQKSSCSESFQAENQFNNSSHKEQQSQLCESYQIQTPPKHSQSPQN